MRAVENCAGSPCCVLSIRSRTQGCPRPFPFVPGDAVPHVVNRFCSIGEGCWSHSGARLAAERQGVTDIPVRAKSRARYCFWHTLRGHQKHPSSR